MQFIQGRGIVEKLVNHIGLYSIMELLIMIGWDDGLGQVNDVQVFSSFGLRVDDAITACYAVAVQGEADSDAGR